jgi:hypothetical protein
MNLTLFADDTCIYATDRNEGYVLRKIQRGLDSMEARCRRWNVKIKAQSTSQEHSPEYFTRTLTRITSHVFHLNSSTKHFTRRVAQITSLEHSHKVLYYMIKNKLLFFSQTYIFRIYLHSYNYKLYKG